MKAKISVELQKEEQLKICRDRVATSVIKYCVIYEHSFRKGMVWDSMVSCCMVWYGMVRMNALTITTGALQSFCGFFVLLLVAHPLQHMPPGIVRLIRTNHLLGN